MFSFTSSGKKQEELKVKTVSSILIYLGLSLVAVSLISLFLIYFSIFRLEVEYQTLGPGKVSQKQNLKPKDTEFGIVIPKIRANAKVVPNVDPFNSSAYQFALTKGVAHAKGSSFPDSDGNVFLFSHSSVNFYEASKYNSIFYLLDKLEKGDQIQIYYKNKEHKYNVYDKKLVDPRDISYLKKNSDKKTLTLMTCWPPGTTFQRLLILAKGEN